MPKQRSFGFLRKARPPINTFTSFFDAPPKLGKKKKKIIEEVVVHEEPQVEARAAQPNGRWNNAPSRTKPVKIKIQGQKGKVQGVRVKVYIKDPTPRKEESLEKYRARLNLNFIKKKYYGSFTQNPRQTGREVMPVSNELTTDAYFNEVYANTYEIGE